YSRVRAAKKEKEHLLKQLFEEKKLVYPPDGVFLRVFKEEKELELWVKSQNEWKYLKTYPICKMSGQLGPKRTEGDLQVPEGFYYLDAYNPWSSFYLSMRIDYPNLSDKRISSAKRLGGDIMLHGDCISIGCIAITDDFIKEVYWLCVLAKNNGQDSVPIHIFPFRFKNETLKTRFFEKTAFLNFWKNLQEGYEYFENQKKLPIISIDKQGKYLFN
ncbi:MAG: L,D-transpeptidase family protein, partial [Flammeovirgaceae bacterium]|nr:L,D-transpeptidase family protein [Flammeovirgaceae bacterium]MDW8288300.1 L,D-transpeptidase family protein [Flammeovirgaceae bacterium]